MHPKLRIDDRQRVATHLAGAGRVIDGAAASPGVIEQLLVALDLGAGLELRRDEMLQVGVRQYLPAEFEPGDNRALVGLGREVIGMNCRRVGRVRTPQFDLTATFRSQLIGDHRKARPGMKPSCGRSALNGDIEHLMSGEASSGWVRANNAAGELIIASGPRWST